MLKLNHLTGFGSGAAAAGGDVTSYAFDGAGHLNIPDHADWSLSTGDFCFEAFVRLNGTGNHSFFELFSDSNNYLRVRTTGSGANVNVRLKAASVEEVNLEPAHGVSYNTWFHLAVTKNSSDRWDLWIDGTTIANATNSTSIPDFTSSLYIGEGFTPTSSALGGYMDEIRISDTARYTTTFTPTTTQFVSDANTLLLIHGGEAYTGALTGEAKQTVYSFDGTGDYLTVPDHADWDFSTNDFVVDLWIYFEDLTQDVAMFSQNVNGANELFFRTHDTLTTVMFKASNSASGELAEYSGDWSPSAKTWYHVALVRNSTNLDVYIDGVALSLSEDVAISTNSMPTHAADFWIGARDDGSPTLPMNGKIAEFRVSKGTNRGWTSNFTPPTERYESDGSTVLLIHGDEDIVSGTTGSGLTFTDSGNTGHTITENGNAIRANGGTFVDSGNTGHTVIENGNAMRGIEKEYKIDPDAVGYFFNGTTDYLSVPDHSDFNHGTSNFTWEAWVMTPDAFPSATMGIMGQWDDSSNFVRLHLADPNTRYNFTVNIGGGMQVNFNPYGNFKPNTWHHIAIVRDTGNLWHLFFDGTSVANDTISVTMPNLSGDFWIGRSISTNYWNGWIDEVRVSDIARYPSGTPFTPSTTQFTSDANTVLLIHCGETKTGTTGSGATFTDSGNTGHTVTENGNAIESTGNLYKF